MTTKKTGTVTKEKLLKKIKFIEASLTDLNRELHDFNKWREAVEEKIEEVKV